jgi:hypothetical protein
VYWGGEEEFQILSVERGIALGKKLFQMDYLDAVVNWCGYT